MAKIEELERDSAVAPVDAPLVVAGVEYSSRLLVGTGKYRNFEQTRQAIEASGAFRGRYHVLMGALNPSDGTESQHLSIAALVARVRRGGVRE